MGADNDIVNIVDGKFSGRSFIHLPRGDWADLRAEIVRLRGEVDVHRLDAGALRVQRDSCIEHLEVQTKNALHLHAMMVDAEARAEQAIAPAEAKGDVPSAIKWCTDNGVPMNNDWRAGWDACRVEYPARASGCGACGDGCRGRGACRVADESPQPAGDEAACPEGRTPAPAMPNGVEARRHAANEWADMATNGVQWLRNIRAGISTADEALAEMESNLLRVRALNDEAQHMQLRAADNRDAAGVVPAWIATWMADREILPDDDGDGISEGALVEALNNHERELLNAIPKAPAAVPAGEAVAHADVVEGWSGLTLAVIGHRHFGNPIPQAWYAAADDLLGRVKRTPPAPVQAAPQAAQVQQEACDDCGGRGELRCAEAGWIRCPYCTDKPANPSACELGADSELGPLTLRRDKEGKLQLYRVGFNLRFATFSPGVLERERCAVFAALQHRGDSQEVGRG